MDLFNNTETIEKAKAKPFIKWAGGKSQLLPVFQKYYPKELKLGLVDSYFEPFMGGASVFFDIVQKFEIKNSYLLDSNLEIILIYTVIQQRVEDLIYELSKMKKQYLRLEEKGREAFFYNLRDKYNKNKHKISNSIEGNQIKRASHTIFLNKTCFNGLYRLNRAGDFNVPFGRYTNPSIYDETNLLNVSKVLQNAEILHGDFEILNEKVNDRSFVYFDPPYRPISETSLFNSYNKEGFNDNEQKRLAKTFRRLNEKNAKLMLSNSDPKNINKDDDYFDDLYNGFNIERIEATRMINSNSEKRGKIKELLITNY